MIPALRGSVRDRRSRLQRRCCCRRGLGGQLLREKNPEIEKQLDRGGSREKQISQRVGRYGPKDHFAVREGFFFQSNSKEYFPRAVPLPGSEGGDMRFAEFVQPPRNIYPARNHAKNVFRGEAGTDDRLLIIFHESAVDLKLGDKFRAHAAEQTVVGKAQLACSRLLFGQNIHSNAGLTDRNTTTAPPRQPFRRALNGA